MTPLVSVVIPTYNRSPTLRREIESVLNQTFRDFELIVVDDGSTDETKQILSAYAALNQLRPVYQAHGGSAAACNHGIRVSKGRYVAIQGSDDEWTPDKLEKAVAVLDSSGPQVGVFYSDMLRILKDGTSRFHKSPEVSRGTLIDENTLDFAVVGIGSQSAVIKRECFEKAGLFDERLPKFLDLDLFIRFLDQFDFIYHKEPLVKWYEGEGISSDTNATVVARLYLLEKYRGRLEGNDLHLAGQYVDIALAFCANANIPESQEFALQALRTFPSHPFVQETASRFLPRLRKDRAIGVPN